VEACCGRREAAEPKQQCQPLRVGEREEGRHHRGSQASERPAAAKAYDNMAI
jgi:hypothetical protein